MFCYAGVNCYVLYWVVHPVINPLSFRLARSVYPLAFVQNFMTTGLIIFRIFTQHHASHKAGLMDVGSKFGPIRVMRIIVESAAIYTIQILILIRLSCSSWATTFNMWFSPLLYQVLVCTLSLSE